mmetsp:Transcript_5177/g.4387  ORF Transcript_5177/g.4387 Transcript_5177/m.4387 type:complete len:269 (-) Transcript_5177:214-1020(-)
MNFAMKVFPYVKDAPNPAFKRESILRGLDHKNIIKIYDSEEKRKANKEGQVFYSSYLLMEYTDLPDFSTITKETELHFNHKLCRTFFHQLISALEYLHNQDIVHGDIKPENLLLGEDYNLKLIDFDFAFNVNSCAKTPGKGTPCYRAPEQIDDSAKDFKALDIYSAGIQLFVFCMGYAPYLEDQKVEGHDLMSLMFENPSLFWTVHKNFMEEGLVAGDSFKELFIGMTKKDPAERLTIDEIKKSKWYNQPIYKEEEIKTLFYRKGSSQ